MQRRSFLSLAVATAATSLAACSTGSTESGDSSPSSPSGSSSSGAAAAGAFPVSIKHAHGTTTVDAAPKRIATLGWGDQDVLVALGVVPVGCPKITWAGNANGTTDAFDAQIKKLGGKTPTLYSDADGIPVDEVAKLQPDLILATNSGITKAEYDKLTKIAPTVVYPGQVWGTSWQQSLDMCGKAVGQSEKAAGVKRTIEKAMASQVSKHPQIKGKTAAWVTFTPADTSKFSIYLPDDNRPRMLTEMGMKDAPMAVELAKSTKTFFAEVSAEKAADLKADVVIFYIEKEGQDADVKKHPLLGQIPAIKRGSYVATIKPEDTVFMSGPTPLNIQAGLPRFLPDLAAAAKKA